MSDPRPPDKLARGLAALALGIALAALVMAMHAVRLGEQYLEDVRVLGESLEERQPGGSGGAVPLGPPPLLDTE